MSILHDSTLTPARARGEVTALAVTTDGHHAFASDGEQIWQIGGPTVLHAPGIAANSAVEHALWIGAAPTLDDDLAQRLGGLRDRPVQARPRAQPRVTQLPCAFRGAAK